MEAIGRAVCAADSDPCSEPLLKSDGVTVALGVGLVVPRSEAESVAESVGAVLQVAAFGLEVAQGDDVRVRKGDAEYAPLALRAPLPELLPLADGLSLGVLGAVGVNAAVGVAPALPLAPPATDAVAEELPSPPERVASALPERAPEAVHSADGEGDGEPEPMGVAVAVPLPDERAVLESDPRALAVAFWESNVLPLGRIV